MEKKRKREKNGPSVSNGVDIAHTLQEQNLEHKTPAEFLPPSSGNVPFPGWQYPPQQQQQQQQQQQPGAAPLQGAPQESGKGVPGSQPGPYWPYPELPVRPPCFDSGWPQPPPSAQSNNPPTFPFPHPGAWYPYPPPYSYFGYPVPGNPSAHKGFIKPPQGLSQKHQKLWEIQSTENIQLWAALARVESELATQRQRLVQLEAEILRPKSNQDNAPSNIDVTPPVTAAVVPPPAVAAGPPPVHQPAKRGRYRKPVMGNIPPEAIAPRPRGRKPSSDKFRQGATKQLLTPTGLGVFPAAPEVAATPPPNGVMLAGSAQQLQQQQQIVVEHHTLSFDPAANKLRRENGAGLNLASNVQPGDGGGDKQSPSVINWAPVIEVASAAARAARSGGSDEEDEDEEDVVLAVPSSQVRW